VVLRGIQILVIDETDRMLDMGFIPDVQKIVRLLPAKRQTLFFSATLSPEIRKLGAEFVTDPKEISVSAPSSASVLVEQGLLQTTPSGKRDALRRLLEVKGVENAIIFLNRKKDVDVLATSLKRHGFAAAAIHGDLAQSVRMKTLESFKKGEIKFLVASDVAARGLDISALPFVINYDVPHHPEDYVHRIGRTARAGLKGTAFTLSVPEDSKSLALIYKLIGKVIPAISLDGSAPAADTPQEIHAEVEKPRRSRGSRSRGRSSGGGPASAPSPAKSDSDPSEKLAETPKPATLGAQEEAKGEKMRPTSPPRARPRSAKPRPAKSTETPKTPNGKPKTDGGDSASSIKDGSAAMGGHVPAFLLRPGHTDDN
jgi:superfamily II DNA/RNA helicase